MIQPRLDHSVLQLPRWLYVLASVVIIFHLGAVSARVLAAMSGPWPMGQDGSGEVYPPQFAASVADGLPGKYLKAVRLDRDFHFTSNRPNQPTYRMEVKLKDEHGQVTQTLTIPDPNANFWVQHRQQALVSYLAADATMRTPQSEVIPPPGQKAPEWTYWKPVPNSMTKAELAKESVNDLARGMTVFVPSDLEMLFVRSYVRHLRRTHGATSVDVTRVAHDPIPPAVMFDSGYTAAEFEARTYSYGDLSK